MPVDLLLYIIVAAVLVIWLRNTLGTRHGEERQRPNPLAEQEKPSAEQRGRILDITDSVSILDDSVSVFQGLDLADKSVEEGLKDIMRADRSFDPHRFVVGAKDAFPLIVEAFADGDVTTLQDLLVPPVFRAFEEAIEGRAAVGETVKTEIHSVRKATLIDARMVERMAYIKIRFTADETCVIRDRDGKITSGNPDRITEMTDVWTFGRDTRSKDPTWLLYETSDDVPEDHKTPLPNAG
jgi:predicted lipid-binding transport protein (Tim44 family)